MIISIADVYDAMTSARKYRTPLCPFEVIAEFEKDEYLQNVLGRHATEKYIEAKKSEWADYRAQVSDWEINNYLYKI